MGFIIMKAFIALLTVATCTNTFAHWMVPDVHTWWHGELVMLGLLTTAALSAAAVIWAMGL